MFYTLISFHEKVVLKLTIEISQGILSFEKGKWLFSVNYNFMIGGKELRENREYESSGKAVTLTLHDFSIDKVNLQLCKLRVQSL